MDAAQALADLTEISSQIRAAALVGSDGETIAGSESLARAARELIEAAGEVRSDGTVSQVEVATAAGSLFVVREGERLVAATTDPEPTVGLVFYDLRAALRSAEDEERAEQKKPRRRRPKKDDEEGGGDGEA
jgi:predicted regulator of Ras-like GTPase activity (Roadblock/LC7/MglB family)